MVTCSVRILVYHVHDQMTTCTECSLHGKRRTGETHFCRNSCSSSVLLWMKSSSNRPKKVFGGTSGRPPIEASANFSLSQTNSLKRRRTASLSWKSKAMFDV
eukprot:scpid92415/ scgid16637/ 